MRKKECGTGFLIVSDLNLFLIFEFDGVWKEKLNVIFFNDEWNLL